MANGVLGLGAGQAASLNSDLIEKLKTAERKSAVAPIEAKIEKMVKEKETFSTIEKKVAELLSQLSLLTFSFQVQLLHLSKNQQQHLVIL